MGMFCKHWRPLGVSEGSCRWASDRLIALGLWGMGLWDGPHGAFDRSGLPKGGPICLRQRLSRQTIGLGTRQHLNFPRQSYS